VILGPYITSVLRLLLPAEFQRDLGEAERALQGDEQPESLLQLGKVLLCAGKIKLAREVLARATAVTADEDASCHALVRAYQLLTELADFGACREWGPAPPPLELALRWSLTRWGAERDAWYRRLPTLPSSVHSEVWFVTQIAPFANEYAAAYDPAQLELLRARIREAGRRLGARELTETIAIGVAAAHVAGARLADDWAEAERAVAVGIELCREAGHGIGEALFGLFGHELSTTRFTVPAAFDLFAADASLLRRTELAWLEDDREAAPRPMAGRLVDWSASRDGFEGGDWDLGVGAGLVMEASWTNRVKPPDMPAPLEIQALVDAKAAFERAGDDAGRQLVDCHLCVLGLEQNYPMRERLATATRLGTWGRTRGSTSFALALGLVLLAVGRRWQRHGYPERALYAVRMARAVFEGLDAPAACADSTFTEAELLTAAWEHAYATPSLSQAIDRYERLLTDTGTPDPEYLGAWWNLRNQFARAAAHQLASGGNLAAVERTRSRLKQLDAMPRPAT
jgi:hypothetical protein